MYCHYIGWCIGKCPLYRGVLYSECPLSEVPLYIHGVHVFESIDVCLWVVVLQNVVGRSFIVWVKLRCSPRKRL